MARDIAATTALVSRVLQEWLGFADSEVKPESRLEEDLGADSLDLLELVMHFEDTLGITIEDEHVENIKTVQQVVDYLVVH